MLIGLYRDDCLWVIDGTNSDIERKRKMIVKIFANCNLKLEDATPIQTRIDFLDVVFDLKNNSFEPYMKPKNEIRYVSIESNHPPMILKQIPRIVEHRISTLSSSKEIFEKTVPPYQKAITDAGYQDILKYSTTNPKVRSKTARSREITWFNPPWHMQVTTNIGRLVLNLVDKHFPKNHSLYPIFNKNTIKISYSCLKNMRKKIASQNMKILNNFGKDETKRGCNCRKDHPCPMNGTCQVSELVYKATVNIENEGSKFYYGLTENEFKTRWRRHIQTFKNENLANETGLSDCIWDLKSRGKNFTIEWSEHEKSNAFKPGHNFCWLCVTEKTHILNSLDDKNMLNKKSELINKCRHKRKFTLEAWSSPKIKKDFVKKEVKPCEIKLVN